MLFQFQLLNWNNGLKKRVLFQFCFNSAHQKLRQNKSVVSFCLNFLQSNRLFSIPLRYEQAQLQLR